jgi:hypothetical protein
MPIQETADTRPIHAWTVANVAELETIVPDADDVGKVAKAGGSFYVLTTLDVGQRWSEITPVDTGTIYTRHRGSVATRTDLDNLPPNPSIEPADWELRLYFGGGGGWVYVYHTPERGIFYGGHAAWHVGNYRGEMADAPSDPAIGDIYSDLPWFDNSSTFHVWETPFMSDEPGWRTLERSPSSTTLLTFSTYDELLAWHGDREVAREGDLFLVRDEDTLYRSDLGSWTNLGAPTVHPEGGGASSLTITGIHIDGGFGADSYAEDTWNIIFDITTGATYE